MDRFQWLRLFSIFSAMMVGFWLPFRVIGYSVPGGVELGIDLLISAASIVNIYLHFHKHELDFKIPKNWLSVSVVLDLITLLPFMLIEDVFVGGASNSLVLANLIGVRHIWKIKEFLDEFDNLKPIEYRLVPLGFMMPLLIHLIACGWIGLGSGTVGPDSDKAMEYTKAFYWAMTTLTTVGYGDISAKTAAQMIYAAVTQLVGVGVFGFVLSNVASLLSRLDAAREHHMDNLDQIEGFMSSYHIPMEIRGKVRSYYHYVWKEHKGRMDKSVLEILPSKLQSELNFAINRDIIEKIPFLKSATTEMIEDVMLALDHKVFVPGERIFRAGDQADALYMIHSGKIEILSAEGKHLAVLSEGAVFGEIALISDSPRTATARALSYCDLYLLPKADFQRIVASYPKFKSDMDEVMAQRKRA